MLRAEKTTAQAMGVNISRAIEQRSCLVVIDNIQEFTDDVMEHLLRHACSHIDNSRIILLGKSKPGIVSTLEPQICVYGIEGLKEDGLKYAQALRDQWKLATSDRELESICTEVQNHPLAIEISLKILCYGDSPADLLKDIVSYKERGSSDDMIASLLSDLHSHATPTQRNFAYRLSVYREPVTYAAVKHIYPGDGDCTADLRELIDGLMLRLENRLYSMHPLVATACYTELKEKADAHSQAADYYISLRTEKLDAGVEAEIVHHLVHADHLADAQKELLGRGDGFLMQGHATTFLTALAEIGESEKLPPELRRLKGKALWQTSRFDDAHTEFTAVAESENAVLVCESKYWLSTILLGKGLSNDALAMAEDCLTTAQALDDQRLLAYSFDALGTIALCQGRSIDALGYHKKSHSILNDLPNSERSDIAAAIGNIGNVYDAQCEYEEALEKHEQGLDIEREIGDRQGEAISLSNVGIIYHKQGKHQAAIDAMLESDAILRSIDLPHEVDSLRDSIAKCRKKLGFLKFRELVLSSYSRLPEELKPYSGYEEYIVDHTVRLAPNQKIGRNDPCPCGSGKKYKKCCADKPSPDTP